MLVEFKLSMPGVNSWNNKWSGSENYYAVVKKFTTKPMKEKAKDLLEKEYFSYNFGDGWCAGVSVKKIDSTEARKIRKKSNGFCGYDWMVSSIIRNGNIQTDK